MSGPLPLPVALEREEVCRLLGYPVLRRPSAQVGARLDAVLAEARGLVQARDAWQRVALEDCEIAHVGSYALYLESGCKRNRVVHCELRDFGGGLSGKPLAETGRHYLEATLKITKGKVPVISSGGVFSPAEARRRIDLGADLVQVYSGFIFYGPDFARDFIRL